MHYCKENVYIDRRGLDGQLIVDSRKKVNKNWISGQLINCRTLFYSIPSLKIIEFFGLDA
jgi:hypothetical protein